MTERTLDDAITAAHATLDVAIALHFTAHRVAGIVVLFSGGSDSTVLAHLFRDRASHFGHANTTIGIESTREFVRRMSAVWGKPLIEKLPPTTYRDLVIERGFPGPGQHYKMYQRLKERGLRQIRRELVKLPRRERVIFLAGRRRDESNRRMNVPEMEREGSVVWVSPLFDWTNGEMAAYRKLHDLPRSEASEMIHMSGECLCGAFAGPDELNEIGFFFPDVKATINALELEVRAAGHTEPKCVWGWGGDPTRLRQFRVDLAAGRLCSSCDARQGAA